MPIRINLSIFRAMKIIYKAISFILRNELLVLQQVSCSQWKAAQDTWLFWASIMFVDESGWMSWWRSKLYVQKVSPKFWIYIFDPKLSLMNNLLPQIYSPRVRICRKKILKRKQYKTLEGKKDNPQHLEPDWKEETTESANGERKQNADCNQLGKIKSILGKTMRLEWHVTKEKCGCSFSLGKPYWDSLTRWNLRNI